MRFTLMLGLGGIEDYQTIAQEAEACGWSSLSMPDSIFYPQISESEYPYLDTETVRQALNGVPVLEPMVAIASMAAVTKTIRFYPGVLKVPVRQPLLLAKALTSAAVVSGGRVSLGAGLSPWKEDFTYNGVPFEERGKRMDECLEILRGAMSGEFFEYHGEHYDFGPMKMSPVPAQPVPILIGGHAKPALRRAARVGDGWISANSDYESLKEMILQLKAFREEFGLADQPFEIHAMDSNARSLDDVRRLQDLGVTDFCLTPWNPYDASLNIDGKVAGIRRMADEFIHKL